MFEEMNELVRSFEDVPIVKIGDYDYFVHPLSDGVKEIRPDLLMMASRCVVDLMPEKESYELLLTVESMGIPITTAVSQMIEKPYSIVRKRRYGIRGEIPCDQMTGYATSELYLNLPEGPGKLVILDDVLSTGGTLKAVTEAVRRSEWSVGCAVLLFNKMGDGKQEVSEELGYPIRTVLDLRFVNGRYVAEPSRNKTVP
ncbi:MAG: adenine phosphoribosyltransferase [Thermoplasmatota archaeon]